MLCCRCQHVKFPRLYNPEGNGRTANPLHVSVEVFAKNGWIFAAVMLYSSVIHYQCFMCNILYQYVGRPGSSEVPRNPLTRWDVSSVPANGIFLTKKLKKQNKNAQRVEND